MQSPWGLVKATSHLRLPLVVLVVALASSLTALAGCARVRSWERGTLAHMEERCEETAGEIAHRRQWSATHEGASGAEGAEPVGCGCK